jgi:DNA-binding winged helix-turn-helix (wHTH) protein/TolB-like protein
MNQDRELRAKYRFAQFEVDAHTGELRKNGLRIRLQEQPFQVLVALLSAGGQLVTRDQLRQHLWNDNTFVEFDHALNTAVKKIRAALSDSPCASRYVETVPRRGYRFIAPVETVLHSSCERQGNEVKVIHTKVEPANYFARASRIGAGVIFLLTIVLLSLATWHVASPPSRAAVTMAVLPFEDMSPGLRQGAVCAGLRQDLTAALGHLDPEHLVVSARRVDEHASSAGLGRKLQVDYILQGSLRQDLDRVRVSVQLVRTRDESYVWMETFDQGLSEPLRAESDLAAEIAGHLTTTLVPLIRASR